MQPPISFRRNTARIAPCSASGKRANTCCLAPSIACTGEGDQRSNHAARGGLGAVMGSKGLKAIVIDKAEASRSRLRMPNSSEPPPGALRRN